VDSQRPLTRGGIYLARLDPALGAEVGKLRPVVILTAQTLLDVDPPMLFICPLSSQSDPAFEPLHLAVPACGSRVTPLPSTAVPSPASAPDRIAWRC
jgi:mRNA-degrading endonuclease toxin of MazEF toxin-antitoxin module